MPKKREACNVVTFRGGARLSAQRGRSQWWKLSALTQVMNSSTNLRYFRRLFAFYDSGDSVVRGKREGGDDMQ